LTDDNFQWTNIRTSTTILRHIHPHKTPEASPSPWPTTSPLLSRQDEDVDEATSLDLLGAGLKPQPLVTVRLQSTLNEALSQLDAHSADALAVTGSATLERRSIAGVLTRGDIEASVRFGSSRAGG